MGIDLTEGFTTDWRSYAAAAPKKTAKDTVTSGKDEKAGKDFHAELLKHMEQMADKIKRGDTEQKFQIGNQVFSEKEWNKMLQDFDKAEEELQEMVEEDIKEREEAAQREALAEKSSVENEE